MHRASIIDVDMMHLMEFTVGENELPKSLMSSLDDYCPYVVKSFLSSSSSPPNSKAAPTDEAVEAKGKALAAAMDRTSTPHTAARDRNSPY